MDQTLRRGKEVIRAFMRKQYTDEWLAMLLAHAQAGKLAFHTCCCFVGVLGAEHALNGATSPGDITGWRDHGRTYSEFPGGEQASKAYNGLGYSGRTWNDDSLRRRRLIPMIKAEMKRRDRLAGTGLTREVVHIGT